jgi:catechol 2,3-dioxygenase-like lactoylglutathione lyase family enzyme
MGDPRASTDVRPARLHHHAFVVRDQETTRRFYEDVVGLPLVATWCEEEDFGEGPTAYCHTFYQLADGSALAFFEFADPKDAERFRRRHPTSVFDHVALAATKATQDGVRQRAHAADIPCRVVDHGYCTSLYLWDPDGLLLELTVDEPSAVADAPEHRARAHAELARWRAGDRRSNNRYRRD